MGALITNSVDINQKLRFVQNSVGAVPSPFDCYMALRGLKTLHVRMDAAQKNALAIAKYLENHIQVERVIYPGLPSHPNYELSNKQSSGPGAMITFFLKGGLEEASKFLAALQLFTLAESLGAVESLAESPAVMVTKWNSLIECTFILSL
jgi:cystathionine gamma-lyase